MSAVLPEEPKKAGNRGKGRPKGAQNKATLRARETIQQVLDANAHKVQGWLESIEEEHGAKAAFDSYSSLVEFGVPKLARTELTGADGGPVSISTTEADKKL